MPSACSKSCAWHGKPTGEHSARAPQGSARGSGRSIVSALLLSALFAATDLEAVMQIAERRRQGEETMFAREEREKARVLEEHSRPRKEVFVGVASLTDEKGSTAFGFSATGRMPLTTVFAVGPTAAAFGDRGTTRLLVGGEVCLRSGEDSFRIDVCPRVEASWRHDVTSGEKAAKSALNVLPSLGVSAAWDMSPHAAFAVRLIPSFAAGEDGTLLFRGELGLVFRD